MFPYPSGRIPYGPCAQLHHGRRGGALQAGARLQRAAPRWAGTRSACRPRTRPWSRASTRGRGPTRTSPRCAASCARWGSRSTGAARSPPAIPAITATSRRCSSTSSRAGCCTAPAAGSTGTRSTARCWPTSSVIDGRGWRSRRAGREGARCRNGSCASPTMPRSCARLWPRSSAGPTRCGTMQENWIGRSEGLRLTFPIVRARGRARHLHHAAPTRCSGRASARSRRSTSLAARDRPRETPEIARFVEDCPPDRDQRGRRSSQRREARRRYRAQGAPPLPPGGRACRVYVANFILMEYGTGGHLRLPGA